MMTDTPAHPGLISLQGIGKRYQLAGQELSILNDVCLSITRGDSCGILGASGSGKSTLLNILGLLDLPNCGQYHFAGHDIFSATPDELAAIRNQQIGFVFQSFNLLPRLSALDNVALPLELRGDPAAKEKAQAMLGRVNLGSRLKHYPKYLSGGEQQRVALARAFVTEPPLLFADEPTGSLDAATGEAVIQLMFELNRERGSTLVLVTHDSSIAPRCGRTITIAAGRLV